MRDTSFTHQSKENTFASFAVVKTNGLVWSVEPHDVDRAAYPTGMEIFSKAPFLLPGGPLELGYSPLNSVRLVAAMQGLELHGEGRQISIMKVEGEIIRFFEFESATPLAEHKLSSMTQNYQYNPHTVPLQRLSDIGYDFLAPVIKPKSFFPVGFFASLDALETES